MRADPEPYDLVFLLYSDSAVIFGDSQGEDWSSGVYALKMKTRVVGVFLKLVICLLCFFSYLLRQFPVAFPETVSRSGNHRSLRFNSFVFPCLCAAIASSASLLRISSEPAKAFSHFASASSSSITHLAKAFCSTSGNLDASLNALSRSFVMLHLSLTLPIVHSLPHGHTDGIQYFIYSLASA